MYNTHLEEARVPLLHRWRKMLCLTRDMPIYLAPDYYETFACKCGGCRNTCCKGWSITVSMAEYYRLLGMSCPRRLRARLDGALHMVEHPDRARYAAVTPNSEGECPLHGKDGLCGLQKAMGENALPSVCRLYPRSVRNEYEPECSCAGSCEAVVELLLSRREPIAFSEKDLPLAPCPQPLRHGRLTGFYRPIRKAVI